MKSKLLNILLIITSLFGYLEWGTTNHSFLFQAEAEFLSKLVTNPLSVLHPFTLLPMAGQIILLVTLFQKQPSKILTYTGMACLAVLLLLMFAIGLMSLNYKILLSTIPFITVAVFIIIHYRTIKTTKL